MAFAKVLSNLNHNNVVYQIGETVEADLKTLKALEKAGVVNKVIDAIEAEIVEPKPAVEAKTTTSDASDKAEETKPAQTPKAEKAGVVKGSDK